MGYSTDYFGEFTIEPPLTQKQVAYLQRFNRTRRMKRNPQKMGEHMPDPLRVAVGLDLGVDGGHYVGDDAHAARMGQDKDPSIVDYNLPPEGQPGLWCQWVPSYDGTLLQWDEGEKFYHDEEWGTYIVREFLKPWGRRLKGRVRYQGGDSDDRGVIVASRDGVRRYPDAITETAPVEQED